MSEHLLQILGSLKDVDGVIGSVVWSHDGQMLARALPEYIDDAALAEVGPRVQRIYDAFASAGSELDAATLLFDEHKLHLRRLRSGMVALLSSIAVNAPTLKMAWNLVGKRLEAAIAEAADALLAQQREQAAQQAAAEQAAAAATAHGAAASSARPDSARRPMMFRGTRVRD